MRTKTKKNEKNHNKMVQLQYGVLVMVYMTVKSMRILSFFTNSAYRATQMN